MNTDCIYVSNTPLGDYCTLANKECNILYEKECDEPEWNYLTKLAEEENDTGTI